MLGVFNEYILKKLWKKFYEILENTKGYTVGRESENNFLFYRA